MNNANKSAPAAPARRGRGRWALRLLATAALLGALIWLFFPRLLDPVARLFRYMGLRDQDSYGVIRYEGGAVNAFAAFDDGLLVGNENGLTLYSLEGEQRALVQGVLPTPVLRTGGGVSLLFSPGSSYAASVGAGGTVLLDGAISGAFVDADVSADGWSAWVATGSGYKSVATVRNPKGKSVFIFSSRTRYLNACAVSPEGEYLAVARLEEENGVYRSGVTILRTDTPIDDLEADAEKTARLELGNQVVYELRFLDGKRLLAVAQDELVFLDVEGNRLAALSMQDDALTDYAVSADGWILLAFSHNGGSRVLTLNAKGETLGELDLSERVRAVSAAGGCAAVLTESWLQTYDRRLNARDRDWDVQGFARVLARPDGTALLVGSGTTKLFIP